MLQTNQPSRAGWFFIAAPDSSKMLQLFRAPLFARTLNGSDIGRAKYAQRKFN
jgi:hypothetical protein